MKIFVLMILAGVLVEARKLDNLDVKNNLVIATDDNDKKTAEVAADDIDDETADDDDDSASGDAKNKTLRAAVRAAVVEIPNPPTTTEGPGECRKTWRPCKVHEQCCKPLKCNLRVMGGICFIFA